MTTYLFPGQGSQTKGMGAELFDPYANIIRQADAILGYSLAELCLHDPHEKLNQTQYTQPALYTVNALMYYQKQKTEEKNPAYLAGHSLGEYNALLAADVFDFETGLKLVQKRGLLMSQAQAGGMMAIIGLSVGAIQSVLTNHHLHNVVIANYNSHLQSVISGNKTEVTAAEPLLKEAGATLVIPLKTSGAFHSPAMQDAQKQFELFLHEFEFSSPKIPVIANTTAKPYPAAKTEIQSLLSQQITHSVRWTETIGYLLAHGETEFEEVGPGKVLTGLVKRIKNGQ